MIRRGIAFLLLFAFVPGCAYRVVKGGELNRSVTSRILEELPGIRGLDFRRTVPMEVQSADTFAAFLEAEIYRETSPEEIADLEKVYHRIGLLDPDESLLASLLTLYSAQVAAYYDPRSAKLRVVHPQRIPRGWIFDLFGFLLRRDFVGEMLVAHELTHALQHQNFGILDRATDTGNEDRALAARAALEGDATLAGFAWVLGGLANESVIDLVRGLETVPGQADELLDRVPALLRQPLLFQYVEGTRFVSWAYLNGGWPAVDALLAHPPTSSEQVLWPEKFFVDRDDPQTVHLGGLGFYEQSWRPIEENTLGELLVRVLFAEHLDRERALWAALGWDGDRFAAFGRDDVLHVVWLTVWDSERDAREFARAETEVLTRLFPDAARATIEDAPVADATLTSDATVTSDVSRGEVYLVERRGDRVLVLIGPTPDEQDFLAPSLWEQSSVGPSPIPTRLDLAGVATAGTEPPTAYVARQAPPWRAARLSFSSLRR